MNVERATCLGGMGSPPSGSGTENEVLVAWYGTQGCRHVGPVKQTESYHCRHPCINRSGHQSHGLASISILLSWSIPWRTFLIVIDTHSSSPQWRLPHLSRRLDLFSPHGLPEVVVSDNGTAFTSYTNWWKPMKKTKSDIDVHAAGFLFQYRITPLASP